MSEALGQLGQDEPASGMALEPLVAFAPISGSVAIALHHRNSESLCPAVQLIIRRYRGYSKLRTHTVLGPYGRSKRTFLRAACVLTFESPL